MTVQLFVGDTRERIKEIPDGSVDLVACSPPFLALRKYGDNAAEMGSERTPADFLDALLELTGEFRRVLAPHGSIAIELGDTYSGSGGAGGDYETKNGMAGMRAGQAKFRQAANWGDGKWTTEGQATRTNGSGRGRGWPLAKSLTLIPTLYPASLAYGWNMLNPAHTFDRWRVRNVIVWARPNPPVGALGDKVRPATSYITVACTSAKRWFDLDAVRTTPVSGEAGAVVGANGTGYRGITEGGPRGEVTISHPAGAPPLDWWEDDCWRCHGRRLVPSEDCVCTAVSSVNYSECPHEPEPCPECQIDDPTGHATLVLPTQPYPGAHYATWPEALAARLIKMMCPLRVCTTCGEPSRRIVDIKRNGTADDSTRLAKAETYRMNSHNHAPEVGWEMTHTTLGWSDCGHDTWRPGRVLDPFAGSGTTLAVAQGLGRDAIGIELYEANAHLVRERVGMFLEMVDAPPREAVVDAPDWL